jgi:hypothetical protein
VAAVREEIAVLPVTFSEIVALPATFSTVALPLEIAVFPIVVMFCGSAAAAL